MRSWSALVPELNNILGWVEQLGEVDTDGVEPLTAVIDQKLRLRDDVVDRRRLPRRGARQCAGRAARLFRGAEGDRMSELTVHDDRRSFATASAPATSRRARLPSSINAAVAAARSLNAYTVETPDDALAAADAADKARGERGAGPLAGIPLGIKDLFATRGVDTTAGSQHPQGLQAALRKHGHRAICARPARACSASSTWTSSRWARRTRPAPMGR